MPALGQWLNLRHFLLCLGLVKIFLMTYLFNKSKPFQHTLKISKWLLKWKWVSVSSELFVSDYTSRSREEHVTQWDFKMLKILTLYLFHRHAQIQVKTKCLYHIILTITSNLNKSKFWKSRLKQNNSKLQMVSMTTIFFSIILE